MINFFKNIVQVQCLHFRERAGRSHQQRIINKRWHNICEVAINKYTPAMLNQYNKKKIVALLTILALPALAFADQMGAVKTLLQILGFMVVVGLVSAIAAIYFYKKKNKWAFTASFLIAGFMGLVLLLIYTSLTH